MGRIAWTGTLALALLMAGCGGDDKVDKTADAGDPDGAGIVTSVTGTVNTLESPIEEGKGQILLDLFHTDRAINQKVKVKLIGVEPNNSAKGEGNQDFTLSPGLYTGEISYSESDLAGGFEGTLTGLKVSAGVQTRYAVKVKAPVGLLRFRFSRVVPRQREPQRVTDVSELEIFRDGDDMDLTGSFWKGPAGEWLALPAGTYHVRATIKLPDAPSLTEWYRDIVVEPGLARNDQDINLGREENGVRLEAFNFGKEVNNQTAVYFFAQGANTSTAVAKASGAAGQLIKADPGLYDVMVVYKPDPRQPDLSGTQLLQAFEVPERGGVRRQIDIERPLGLIRLAVTAGEEDISDEVELRVMREGADRFAGSPVLDEVGVSSHPIPVGTYDIYVTAPASGDREERQQSFPGIQVTNGAVWQQAFDAAGDATWSAEAIKAPAAPPKPLDWRSAPTPEGRSG